MGHFQYELLQRYLKGPYEGISTIVETGTCRGVGTRVMAQSFERVYTIELDPALHQETRERLLGEGFDNITFIQGDSAQRLAELVTQLDGPCVFFLDAHWSGDSTVDWEHSQWKGYKHDTAHTGSTPTPTGTEQVPLDREFTTIATDFPYGCIIYVDDVDKFDWLGRGRKDKCFVGEDWSHLNLRTLRASLGDRVDGWDRKKGQLIVTIKPKAP